MLTRIGYFLMLTFLVINGKMNASEDDFDSEFDEDEELLVYQYVDEITDRFFKQVNREHGYDCGTLGKRIAGKVEEISIHLVAFHTATIDEARELEVILTERLAQMVNAHEKVRPFLAEHPFSPHRLDVSIRFEEPNRKEAAIKSDQVRLVLQSENKICYQSDNPNSHHLLTTLKEEPYIEAREAVYKKIFKNSSEKSTLKQAP